MRWKLCLAILTTLALAGCGSSSTPTIPSGSKNNASERATSKGPSEVSRGRFGSTLAAWEKAHPKGSGGNGSGCSGEGCYGEKVTVDGESLYQFTSFSTSGPPEYRVTGYEQVLGENISIEQAKSDVLMFMPPDTKPTAFFVSHEGGSCALWNLKSATLGRLLAKDPKIGDTQGAIGVVFGTHNSNDEPSYSPTNVNDAIVGIAASAPGTSC